MEVKQLRLQTGLSQNKFARIFDIPVSTLKDWERKEEIFRYMLSI
ncbi:MAG: helix-turn-helix domain-containing protein [Erysipelotrichaceae bacterium]